MGVYIASLSTNTNQDIRARPLMGAGTAQSRIHALIHALAPRNAPLLLRAESCLCVRSSVASPPQAAHNLAKNPSFPSTPSDFMLPYHSACLLAASERVGGLRTRKRRHPGREVVGPLTWTWHRAVHVRAYRSWAPHASTMRICLRSTHFPVSCTCIRSCGSLRSTFLESRGFSRTRRCRGLRGRSD